MKRPCKRITNMRFLSSTVTYKFSNLTVNIEIMNIINYSSHTPPPHTEMIPAPLISAISCTAHPYQTCLLSFCSAEK